MTMHVILTIIVLALFLAVFFWKFWPQLKTLCSWFKDLKARGVFWGTLYFWIIGMALLLVVVIAFLIYHLHTST